MLQRTKLFGALPAILLVATATLAMAPGDIERTTADLNFDFPSVTTIAAVTGDASLKSAEGKDFRVLQFDAKDGVARVDAKYHFLIQGGIHGNEEQASNFVMWLARRYAHGQSLLNLLPKDLVAIDFLPFANPDGTAASTRVNGRGVNLNRNYGVLWGISRENPGTKSFSEPETRAIRALFIKRKYAAAVDMHGYVNWVVSPSTPEMVAQEGIIATAKQKTAYRRWMAAFQDEMPLLKGYEFKTAGSLGDGGAFEDWAFWNQGTFAYCLEMETFQRYVKSYRRDFNDPSRENDARNVDLFMRYEAFVARMFEQALKIREAAPDGHLAAN